MYKLSKLCLRKLVRIGKITTSIDELWHRSQVLSLKIFGRRIDMAIFYIAVIWNFLCDILVRVAVVTIILRYRPDLAFVVVPLITLYFSCRFAMFCNKFEEEVHEATEELKELIERLMEDRSNDLNGRPSNISIAIDLP